MSDELSCRQALIDTHTLTHRPTDAADDNTRRPKLASGKNDMNPIFLHGFWFSKIITSSHFRKSHCRNKKIKRSSYPYNKISHTGKMPSSCWMWTLLYQTVVLQKYMQHQLFFDIFLLPMVIKLLNIHCILQVGWKYVTHWALWWIVYPNKESFLGALDNLELAGNQSEEAEAVHWPNWSQVMWRDLHCTIKVILDMGPTLALPGLDQWHYETDWPQNTTKHK